MNVNFIYKNGRERAMSERDAKILKGLGKGEYLTRDLVAARDYVAPTIQPIQASLIHAELDAAGDAWSDAIHVASRLKNNDGTWRRKPGAKA